MTLWEWIAIGYFTYLLIVASLTGDLPGRESARSWERSCAARCSQCSPCQWLRIVDALTFAILVPLPVLLGGYWLSGLFFVSPMRTPSSG